MTQGHEGKNQPALRLGCEFILFYSPDDSRRSATKCKRQGASPPVMTQAFFHSLGAKGLAMGLLVIALSLTGFLDFVRSFFNSA